MIREDEQSSYEHFERLREQSRREVDRGRWESALALCNRTVAWAEMYGGQDEYDQEFCNYSGILVAQGGGDQVISKLRQILLSSSNPKICYHAAYNISRFHEMRQQSERGLFYARLCLDHAKKTQQAEPIARSHNQLGLLLVRDSYFEEAADAFGEALSVLAREPSQDLALVLSNLGCCQVMLGRLTPGFSHLYKSLRMVRKQCADISEICPRMGLSFAYLEIDRPERATVHAERALLLAEQAEIQWQVKNALYLLGESEKLSGDEFRAHRTFTRLQREYYPEDPVIPDFLMATNVRKMINLMA